MDILDKTAITIPNALFFESIIEILALGKTAKFNLRGNSMRPFLYEGDQILLKSLNHSRLQLGQIVLAKYQNNFVLHRIVRIKNNEVWLAGDGNLAQVEIVALQDLIAIVHEVHHKEKKIILTTQIQYSKGLLWYYFRPIRHIIKKLFGKKKRHEIKK